MGKGIKEDYYIAHTESKDTGKTHSLEDHTEGVMKLSVEFSKGFDRFGITETSALMHDVGKKSEDFQKYIRGNGEKRGSVKHAMGGSIVLKGIKGIEPLILNLISLMVLGHHVGMTNFSKLEDKLKNVPKELIGIEDKALEEKRWAQNKLNTSSYGIVQDSKGVNAYWYISTLTRMCFSALVDADWLDTEKHFNSSISEKREYNVLTEEDKLRKLNDYMDNLTKGSKDTEVNKVRREIYEKSVREGKTDNNFYTLHAPTGGGKTLASLAFALNHLKENKEKKRVIFALPLTSVTEQTSEIYREIIGKEQVVEHHSQVRYEDTDEYGSSKRLAVENWDRDIIVTTTVQLFESLFSNKPSKLRKLHRIAGSIIVLDEYQKLPLHVLKPILEKLKILREKFNVTVLLMSATPIALEESKHLKGVGTPIPIIDNGTELTERLKRVKYNKIENELSYEDVVEHMREHESVLCIMNTRKEAQEVYKELIKHRTEWKHVYHISTTMCSEHRLEVIRNIKEVPKGESIAVVSTSILEAGVDLSFSSVYRMYAPLDSLVQTAGRCNRNGEVDTGNVYLFDLKGRNTFPSIYEQETTQTKLMLNDIGLDFLEKHNDYIIDYYRRVYSLVGKEGLDVYGLKEGKLMEFQSVGKEFKMIQKDNTVSVMCVGYKGFPRGLLSKEQKTKNDYRDLQKYVIPLTEKEVERLGMEEVDGIYIWDGIYDKDLGYELLG